MSKFILVFFVATESNSLYLSGPCFQCFNVASISPAISFRSLMFPVDGECIIISTPNSYPILVFFVATESDHSYLSRAMFHVSMWPVLVLQFHFEV